MAPHDTIVSTNGFFYYFAYGSNLLEERLRVQIKGAIFENTGVLRGYRLDFFDHSNLWNGAVASIEPSEPENEVWGCVWRVPIEFGEELDLQEQRYHRIEVAVENDSGVFDCVTYRLSNVGKVCLAPSPQYKHVIVKGALEHNLPEHYLLKLMAVQHNGSTAKVPLTLKVFDDLHSTLDCFEN